jgi:hypothetical protein
MIFDRIETPALGVMVIDRFDPWYGKKNRLCKFSATHASFQEKSKYFLAWD